MSSLLAKLLPGSSSSAQSDVTCMETLCKIINDLSTESTDSVGPKVAELTRKSKEIFEKKTVDIEAFLLNCSPNVGSAAMIAAIKAMFDTSFAKNYEHGTDRAVELLKHYLDEGKLVSAHLKIVPDIVFPLIRCVGFYCLEKKNEPEIGESIIISALEQLLFDDPNTKNFITSCHCALFACALRTRNFKKVEPFIVEFVEGIFNEVPVDDAQDEAVKPSEASSSKPAKSFDKDAGNGWKSVKSKMTAGCSSVNTPVVSGYPHINPNYILQYLYYGALILIELKQYKRAMILLEACVSLPAVQASDLQLEAYKKFILVSLLVEGKVLEISDRSIAVNRIIKSRLGDYRCLTEIRFKRGDNTHGQIQDRVSTYQKRFEADDNLALLELVELEMKKKAVLAVCKLYSSIKVFDIKRLAGFVSDEETLEIIESLVNENRITVRFDATKSFVIWSENVPEVTAEQVANVTQKLDWINQLLQEKLRVLSTPPFSKSAKSALNDDEGLSMHQLEA
ncbi:unnamed protein product [Caenorhabditis bovis]|uniref:COP9 signalosome complex subunit 3 n=1 Tax=Caenorhabditis bovis TaxID=2654633 RepID=A0A8S1EY42_9PELO|nr:unnamed protein product [Caenorhabditis bovis]